MDTAATNSRSSAIPADASSSRIAQFLPTGLEYALRISVGCCLVWYILQHTQFRSPLWALISVITVTEPELNAAWRAFLSRILNTLVGAAVGMVVLYLLGTAYWAILLAITVSVLICTLLIRVPGSWRLAPVTVTIVMMPSLLVASRAAGISAAIDRTEEVLIGSATALLISLVAGYCVRFTQRFAGSLTPSEDSGD